MAVAKDVEQKGESWLLFHDFYQEGQEKSVV